MNALYAERERDVCRLTVDDGNIASGEEELKEFVPC